MINKNSDINLAVIGDILKQSGRKYLNIYRPENEDDENLYALSYITQDVNIELKEYDYIVSVLEEYIKFLNIETKNEKGELEKKNKVISMNSVNTPSYIPGKSVLLDVTAENWEKYTAGVLFVKKYMKKNAKNTFSLNIEGLNRVLKNENYKTYIFTIDKINFTFNFNRMIKFLESLNTIENINTFFLNYKLQDINIALKDKLNIGTLDIKKKEYEKFKELLTDINFNKKSYDIKDYAYILTRKLFSLHFEPFALGKDNEGKKYYNRKEILKLSKTEEKVNDTFANEIFNLAFGT